MADFGIRVSKPGKSVSTTGVENLYMDTTYPILKIKASGTGSLSISDGGSDSDTITHNLGYIPKVLVYGEFYSVFSGAKSAYYRRYPISEMVSTYTSNFGYTISTTQLVISGSFYDELAYSGTFNYFYYLFYDEQ
jgi:hypothetical protein